jgi:hypothetical protein
VDGDERPAGVLASLQNGRGEISVPEPVRSGRWAASSACSISSPRSRARCVPGVRQAFVPNIGAA